MRTIIFAVFSAQAMSSTAADFPKLKQQIDSTSHSFGIGTCSTTRTGTWLAEGGVVIDIQKPKGRCDFESLALIVEGEVISLTAVDSSFYSRRVPGGFSHSWYRGDSGKVFFATSRTIEPSTKIQGILEVGCTTSNCLDEELAIPYRK